jgi:hypothetical protein
LSKLQLLRLMLCEDLALSTHIEIAQRFWFLVDDEASAAAKRSEFIKDAWTLAEAQAAQWGGVQSGQTEAPSAKRRSDHKEFRLQFRLCS